MDPTPIISPTQPHVVLIGDSTLDNLIWVDNKVDRCVIGKLRSRKLKVTNFACDGFTSSDVLNGNRPMLSAMRWANVGEPFPGCEKEVRVFKPLDELNELLKKKNPPTHVVLSVGGNDIREILRSMHLLKSVIQRYHSNAQNIFQRLIGKTKIVLMLQYRPSFYMDADGYGVYQAMRAMGPGSTMLLMNRLMNAVYAPILQLCQKNGIPIVDLPRTFDPYKKEYFKCQIEPSEKGSDLIAEMIEHVIRNHRFDGPSIMYSKNLRSGTSSSSSSSSLIETQITLSKPWVIDRYNDDDGAKATSSSSSSSSSVVSVSPLDHAVQQLMDMGFLEMDVRDALKKSGNLPQRAIEHLLSSKGGAST